MCHDESMRLVAYMAVSLDGYIADSDGGVDWLNEIPDSEGDDHGWAEFMAGIDALLMGANTFKVVQGFGVWHYEKPVFVASRSMVEVPEGYEDKIELIQGDIAGMVAELEKRGHESIYVDGGLLVQRCLETELLNEMIITRIPIILGGGIPLFAVEGPRVKLRHVATKVLGAGMVQSHYCIDKP